ncbi:MAG: SGNH/GDSL hydrolase family protein [Xenococcaceae cyanobacterium MO_188.B29]|nr:SGNH/GDSL hydrolase family protein [Xenococcaceae cyanobacterium MO_188.B29]
MSIGKLAKLLIFLTTLWTLPVSASTLNIEQIYIFGDSNSDQGNLYNISGFPPEPYFYQGRFTNGPNWIDYLSNDLSLNPELYTNLNPGSSDLPTDGINFTFGGATSGDINIGGESLPGLQQQVDYFADLYDEATVDPDALYMIWIGPNDYVNSLNNGVIDPNIPTTAVNNITAAIDELNALGANNILVFNEPNVSFTPLGQSLPPEAIPFLSDLTEQQNELLAQSVNQLNQANPELNLVYFDTDRFLQDILDAPSEFGLTNVTDNCSGIPFPDLPDNFSPCDNPDEYLFWDNQHPTTVVHRLIADEVIDTVKSEFPNYSTVPEPSMFTALGFFGLSLLRTKKNKV